MLGVRLSHEGETEMQEELGGRDLTALRERWTAAAVGRPVVWSYGGGVQLAAIAVLVLRGDLPRPEQVVVIDTSCEASATWAYPDGVVQPAVAEVGLRVEIAPHSLVTRGLTSNAGKPMMPVYTRAEGDRQRAGRVGQTRNFCSGEWKREVVRRYSRSLGYGPVGRSELGPVVNWLGISRDKVGRMGADRRK